MKKRVTPNCASCQVVPSRRACMAPGGETWKGCPTSGQPRLLEKAREVYQEPGVHEFARQASIQEGACYAGREQKPYVMHPVKPRVLEIGEFASRMGYKRLGLIFCMGLFNEAAVVGEILRGKGFEIVSAGCKAGCVPKEEIGVKDSEKVYTGEHESMCNPIFQAMLVNESKTDFNVLLGLCVGHDSLVFKYAEAPTTVLAVKDRVTGHNPLAAVYASGTYFAWLKERNE